MPGATARAKDFHLLLGADEFLLHGLGSKERYIATGALRTFAMNCVSLLLGHLLSPSSYLGGSPRSRSLLELAELADQFLQVWSYVDIMNVHITDDTLFIDDKKGSL